MKITTIGIDLAKIVFQIHGVDARGKVAVRKQLKRAPCPHSGFVLIIATGPDLAFEAHEHLATCENNRSRKPQSASELRIMLNELSRETPAWEIEEFVGHVSPVFVSQR